MAVQTAKLQNLGGSQILYNDLRKRAASADGNLADEYSASKTYAVGDFVVYLDKLYTCKTAITTPEAWTATHWEETSMGEETSALKSAIVTKAEEDGYYEELTAGSAEQLVSTEAVTDTTPYLYRKSGGSVDIGNRETLEKIVGGTVAWNQLNNNSYSTTTEVGITATKNADGSWTIDGTATGNKDITFGTLQRVNGHKYMIFGCPSNGGSTKYYIGIGGGAVVDIGNGGIYSAPNSNVGYFRLDFRTGVTFSNVKIYPQIFDITQMFGPTIADYVYSLEQTTAGAGVAWFRKLFPKDYYPYNPGELISVKPSSHDMVGFNLWDEEWEIGGLIITDPNNYGAPNQTNNQIRAKNYIPVLPDTNYYFHCGSNTGFAIAYDENKTGIASYGFKQSDNMFTTPSNCAYLRFYCVAEYGTTYNHDICINLSHSGSRNGEYEPYEKHSYPLADVELRGPLAIDENGKLVYSGDEYPPDGNVKRKYGIVDLGTLNYDYGSTNNIAYAVVSGMNNTSDESIRNLGLVCSKYPVSRTTAINATMDDKSILRNSGRIYVRDTAYTDAASFKAAMDGVYLLYELAIPTTEQVAPYTPVQVVDDWGTEEFVDNREVAMPVGHSTSYMANLRDKLQHLPSLADDDGEYIVKQTGTNMELAKLSSSGLAQSIYESIESTPVASFKDGADGQAMKAVNVAIEPVQDLHGYDSPWPAGGGKNLFNSGLFSTSAVNGVTFTLNSDGAITTSGTATATAEIQSQTFDIQPGTYKLNGVANGASLSPENYNLSLRLSNGSIVAICSVDGADTSFTVAEVTTVHMRIRVFNGVNANNLVFKPMIRLASVSDASFAPYSNICPISGWTGVKVTRTGKNLAGPITDHPNGARITGYTAQGNWPKLKNIYKAGTYSLSVTAYSPNENGNKSDIRMWFHRLSDQKWCNLNGQEAGGLGQMVFPSVAGSITTTPQRYETTFVLPFDCDEITLGYYYSGRYLEYSDLQLELGSTATAYEPYQGQTYEVTFPSEAGTVYGGTLDVASGKLVVDMATIIMRGLLSDGYSSSGSDHMYYGYVSSTARPLNYTNQLWSHVKRANPSGDNYNCGIMFESGLVRLHIASIEQTVAAYREYLNSNEVQCCYQISPVSISLTPTEIKTLLGSNNIWSDAGNTAVTYPADTKLYIEKRISELQALILENL